MMKASDVRETAYSMPLTSPAYPRGPYRFVNREFLIITYRTDPDKLRAVVPEPLQIDEPLVKFEFIRMPDSTGFGDYTESGQVIPVRLDQETGGYSHPCISMTGRQSSAGASCGDSPKNMPSPRFRSTAIHSSARLTTDQCGLQPELWASSTLRWIMAACSRPSPHQTSC